MAKKNDLNRTMEGAVEKFMAMRWYSRAFMLSKALHPWIGSSYADLFVSHVARVAIMVSQVLGISAGICIFQVNLGGASSRESDPACKTESAFEDFIKQFAIGIACSMVAESVVGYIMRIRIHAGQLLVADEQAQEDEIDLQEEEGRYWWATLYIRMFWLMLSLYCLVCVYTVLVVLAILSKKDGEAWLVGLLSGLLETYFLQPTCMALFFVAVISLIGLFCPHVLEAAQRKREVIKSLSGECCDDREEVAQKPTLLTSSCDVEEKKLARSETKNNPPLPCFNPVVPGMIE
eukprot:TRINITY_DN54951_c0_g1_i1.p1 TRINITY_DN54951_c0_g1~~TRINITY_DN54951_c0_g1_i1.p1  ORF type:complete len:331 (-),score=60.48 TRINITY_DN54951_c0_g1_i1:39-911(-)